MSEKKAKEQRKELCCNYWKGKTVNKLIGQVQCEFCPECGRNLKYQEDLVPWYSIVVDVLPPKGAVQLSGFPANNFHYCMMVFGAAIQRLANHFKAKETEEISKIIKPDINVMDLLNKNKKGFG